MNKAARAHFQAAELDEVTARAKASEDGYAAEVLVSDLLSVGLYTLEVGAVDDQTPHTEDEVYYAVSGHGTIRVGGEDHPVKPGSLLFVPALEEHYFHGISEDLVLVVFWAPPEGTVKAEAKEDQ